MLYFLAYYASNTINSLLVVLILQEPLLVTGTRREIGVHTLRFYTYALVSVGVAVLLAEAGKKYEVWHGHPGFPSGHATFATAAATCILLQRGNKWGYLLVPLVLLMSIALVYGRWHTPVEVFAAWILGIAIPAAFRLKTGRRKTSLPPVRGEGEVGANYHA